MAVNPNKINEFRNLIVKIEDEHRSTKPGMHKMVDDEKNAFHYLCDYWKYNDFNAAKCNELLAIIKKRTRNHPGGWTEMKMFQRICADFYTKDKDDFLAFQKALGGKQPRPQSQSQSVPKPAFQPQQQAQPQPIPKPAPNPIPEQKRINRTNFDFGPLKNLGAEIWNSIPYWPYIILIIVLFMYWSWTNFIFGFIFAGLANLILKLGMSILERIRAVYLSFPRFLKMIIKLILLVLILNLVWKNVVKPRITPKQQQIEFSEQ
jgi:hypothetical protein